MRQTYRDEGIVLKTAKLGEADRIITMFTRDHGKIRAVAKGVRKMKSKFGACLEPFMHTDVLLVHGKTFEIVSQASALHVYGESIVQNFQMYSAGLTMLELVNDLHTIEGECSAAHYRLLLGAVNALAMRRHEPRLIVCSYILRALSLSGWTPVLDECALCGCNIGLSLQEALPIAEVNSVAQHGNALDVSYFFSPQAGGLVCERHPDYVVMTVSRSQIVTMQALLQGNWQQVSAICDTDTIDALLSIVQKWGEYYTETQIRSLRLLH